MNFIKLYQSSMKPVIKRIAFGATLAAVAGSANAMTPEELEVKLRELMPPSNKIESVAESAMPGVFEVSVGGRTIYVYGTDGHLLVGEAYDIEKKVTLASIKQGGKVREMLKVADPETMIVMKPEKTKRVLTIFTDIDCGYCRKLHDDVPGLLEAGIEVRYLMFPRAGLGSGSFAKAVSAWCADDKVTAITAAKRGQDIPAKTCENPVADQYNLGLEVGVTGTPTIIFDDGTVVPGYLPKERLIGQMGLKEYSSN